MLSGIDRTLRYRQGMASVSAMHHRIGGVAKWIGHPGPTRGGVGFLRAEGRHAFRSEVHHGL